MGETKKKNTWISWVIIALVYVGLLIYLMAYLQKESYANAETAVYDKLLSYIAVRSQAINSSITHAEECGGIVSDLIEEENLDLFDSQVIALINRMKENTTYFRICVVDKDENIMDDTGEQCDYSPYRFYFDGTEFASQRILFLNVDDKGNEKVIVSTYPLNDGFLMFFLDVNDVLATFDNMGYENTSFGAIIRKDGTVLKTFDRFVDSNSKFVTGTNLLTAVQMGSDKDEYNAFKSKLYGAAIYSKNGCAIASSYENDERTIVLMSLDIEDWYICAGFRQYEVDQLISFKIKNIQSTSIKLIVSIVVFVAFSIALLLMNFMKSREKGKQLEDRADTDLLTELTNKAATERMISEYLEENPDSRGLLFILDIDNFKKVNDTMGHAFGDVLLKTLGKQIRTEFRVTDIVGRTGGDEFMIFLKGIKDDLIVEREANRVTHFFHDFKAGDGYVKYSATASIGAAVFPDDGKNFKELYVSADQALYRAKKRGKNQLVFFNEEKYGNK